MKTGHRIAVIIPAVDEERSIGKVVSAVPYWVDQVLVVDNGSQDRTGDVARAYGADVLLESQRGYGAACLAGVAAVDHPEVVVFLDGDYSDYPEEMDRLVDPILHGDADLVLGSRVSGERKPGALKIQARVGNWLACSLIRLFWGAKFTDLGPFRAIRFSILRQLDMKDRGYGWTVEMQIKAAAQKIPFQEVPVQYRRRIGKSKISGTIKGFFGAGAKILARIFLSLFQSFKRRESYRERLILFTRYPKPGKTKTRLIPVLGAEQAADLQREMTEYSLRQAKAWARRPRGEKNSCESLLEVRFDGGDKALMRNWLGPDLSYRGQGSGDLGDRLVHAFRASFRAGMTRVVIMGTDCPALTHRVIREAFEALKNHDLVLGPATDGGYYLIGLRREIPELFVDLPWGTGDIFRQTLEIANRLSVRVFLLDELPDVDRPEDLALWEATTKNFLYSPIEKNPMAKK